MHYVIIWQRDKQVETILQPLLARGAGDDLVQLSGHHVRLCEMMSEGSPKGEWYDPHHMFAAILNTAVHALQTPERLAQMHVMFIFHQTSRPAVAAIMKVLYQFAGDVLDGQALAAGKNLHVQQVVLLSCESATDKVVPEPVPPAMTRWVDQARDMRRACFDAFTIRKVDGADQLSPVVVTFSTGNAETGGVVLNPWNPKFVSLRGHFDENGDWQYDLDANGNPDKTADDSGGTVYGDSPDGSPSSTQIAPGEPMPPLLPSFPPP